MLKVKKKDCFDHLKIKNNVKMVRQDLGTFFKTKYAFIGPVKQNKKIQDICSESERSTNSEI